jgi:DNA-binding transcriptional LysR family regulator
MELHQVRYFLAVCRTLNFTRAAEDCNVAQPSLTRAIQKLEEEFGGLLFHRERANTHLTELGRAMQPLLERTFEAAQSARQLAAGFRKGEVIHLRLGIADTVPPRAVAMLLKGVQSAIPEFELTLVSGPDQVLTETAISGDLDLFLAGDDTQLPDRIRSWPLHREELLLVLPPDHALQHKPALEPADLNALDMIEIAGCGIAARFRQICQDKGVSPSFRASVATPAHALSLVHEGLGTTLLPASIAAWSPLRCQPLGTMRFERAITLCTVAGRKFSPASDAFVKLARARDWERELLAPAR